MPRRTLASLLLACLLGTGTPATAAPDRPRLVELAICLDTSVGMAALRDTARLELGRLLLAIARWEPEPEVRIGLVLYGDDAARQVRVAADLSGDADAPLEDLIEAPAAGGVEDVPAALRAAHHGLTWSRRAALQAIVLVGNESPHQVPEGPDPRDLAREAARDGLAVHVLYAGGAEDLFADAWRAVAAAGQGAFLLLDLPEPGPSPRQTSGGLAEAWVETLLVPDDLAPRLLARHAAEARALCAAAPDGARVHALLAARGRLTPRADLVRRWREGSLDAARPDGWPPPQARMGATQRQAWIEAAARRRDAAAAQIADRVSLASVLEGERARAGLGGRLAALLAAQARRSGFAVP